MPKILVADDEEDQEELIMQRSSHKDYLRKYEFIFAMDGLQALQLVKEHTGGDKMISVLVGCSMIKPQCTIPLPAIGKTTTPVMRLL